MYNPVKYFYRIVSTEILKNRRTIALWLTLLYPLFTVALVTLFLYGMKHPKADPWLDFIQNINSVASFFLPFFIILVVGYACNMENKSNTWKHLQALPIPRWSLFFGKISYIFVLLAFSLLLFVVFAHSAAFILSNISPKYSNITGWIDFNKLVNMLVRTYLAGFAIIAIQYWISLRRKNLVFPITIGITLTIMPIAILMVLGIAGILKNPQELKDIFRYNPYSYPFSDLFNFTRKPISESPELPRMTEIFLVVAAALFVMNYFDFRKRNIK